MKIYFDGLCLVCSKEIDHYRKLRGSESMIFVDITDPSFNAHSEGLDPRAVHREIHVRKADGQVAVGVDAFIAIWDQLPRYRFLSKLARQPWIKPFLKGGYFCFARIRRFLPKRKKGCEASPYCETKQ